MTTNDTMTDNELRIAVAKAQGYSVELRKPNEQAVYDKWCVIAPDGSVLVAYARGSIKRMSYLYPGEGAQTAGVDIFLLWDLPDLLADLGACLRLFPNDVPVVLARADQGCGVVVDPKWPGEPFEGGKAVAHAQTPERALLLAFLAWKGEGK